MRRNEYKLFSAGKIGNLTLPNRLVRSATWDPSIIISRQMSDEVLDLYRELALGGVGMIITGGFPVVEGEMLARAKAPSYDDLHVDGIERMAAVVHSAGGGCQIVAQLEVGYLGAGPSDVASPFLEERIRPLSLEEIRKIVGCFVEGIARMKACGFDGVQLHAAHTGGC